MDVAPPPAPLGQNLIQSPNNARGFVVDNNFSGATMAPQLDVKSFADAARSVAAIGKGISDLSQGVDFVQQVRQKALDQKAAFTSDAARQSTQADIKAALADPKLDPADYESTAQDIINQRLPDILPKDGSVSRDAADHIQGQTNVWAAQQLGWAKVGSAQAAVQQAGAAGYANLQDALHQQNFDGADSINNSLLASHVQNATQHQANAQLIGRSRNQSTMDGAMALVSNPDTAPLPGTLDKATAMISAMPGADKDKQVMIGRLQSTHRATLQYVDATQAITSDPRQAAEDLLNAGPGNRYPLLSSDARSHLFLRAQQQQANVSVGTFNLITEAIDQGHFDMKTGTLAGAAARQLTPGQVEQLHDYQDVHNRQAALNDPEHVQRLFSDIIAYRPQDDPSGLAKAHLTTGISSVLGGPVADGMRQRLDSIPAQGRDIAFLGPPFKALDQWAFDSQKLGPYPAPTDQGYDFSDQRQQQLRDQIIDQVRQTKTQVEAEALAGDIKDEPAARKRIAYLSRARMLGRLGT